MKPILVPLRLIIENILIVYTYKYVFFTINFFLLFNVYYLMLMFLSLLQQILSLF